MDYGLTDGGFIVKPYAQIEKELEEDFKSSFGEEIDVSPTSIAGAYLRTIAVKISQIWEVLGGLYASGDINSSWGVYLDRLAYLVRVQRMGETSTRANVALWGNEGTAISAGHLVKDAKGNQYALTRDVTLENPLCGIQLKFSGTYEETYSLIISGIQVDYVRGQHEVKAALITGFLNKIESLFPSTFSMERIDDSTVQIYASDYVSKFSFAPNSDNLEIKLWGQNGVYSAMTPGALYCAPESLVKIVNNVDGLKSCINYAQGASGSETESDDDFRNSIKRKQNSATGTDTALEKVVSELDEVSYARCYSNRMMVTDSNGRPAKSFEIVVDGGDDTEIAQAIFDYMPAGIQAWGTTVVTIKDSKGKDWEIGFSRPERKYLWIDVSYAVNGEESISQTVETDMRNALVTFAAGNINIGTDIIYQKFIRVLYSMDGLSTVNVKVALTDTAEKPDDAYYHARNIQIADREFAVLSADQITISEIG